VHKALRPNAPPGALSTRAEPGTAATTSTRKYPFTFPSFSSPTHETDRAYVFSADDRFSIYYQYTDTPTGTYFVQQRFLSQEMIDPGYDLPNVPYVQYFGNDNLSWQQGYSLHGTYWHHNWGHVMSHGCVNLSPDRAVAFFNFSQVGDVVIVENSPRVADAGDGEGDWQIPFAQFANSGGQPAVAAPSNPPGGV